MYMEMTRVDDQTITGNEHSNPDLVTMHTITRHHLRQVNRKRFNTEMCEEFRIISSYQNFLMLKFNSHCISKIVMSRETVLSNKSREETVS